MDLTGLFNSSNDPNLNIPHLAQFQVGTLIDEMRRTLALQHLGPWCHAITCTDSACPPTFQMDRGSKPIKEASLSLRCQSLVWGIGPFRPDGPSLSIAEYSGPIETGERNTRFSFSLIRDKGANWLKFGNKQESLHYSCKRRTIMIGTKQSETLQARIISMSR